MEKTNTMSDIDKLTLTFLTATTPYEKVTNNIALQESAKQKKQLKEDKKFYRKRIIQLTKDMFVQTPNPENANLKKVFNNYICGCIDYFKMVDTQDILQKEYDDASLNPVSSGPIDENFNPLETDIAIGRSTDKIVNMNNYVIKTPLKQEKKIIPLQKEVDLKDPKLKQKGVKSKMKKEKQEKQEKQEKGKKQEKILEKKEK